MKDIDGARTMDFEAIGDSIFVWGRGFSYEFDKGLFIHQIRKILDLVEQERVPVGGTLCFTPCERFSRA